MTSEEEDWIPYFNEPDAPKEQLVPFVPSTLFTAEQVIELLNIKETDSIIDLGCGDGRIIFKAVQMKNCTGVGIDINKELIDECNKKKTEQNLNDKIQFYLDDFSRKDFNFYNCTCVCFYLVPKILKIIENKIKEYIREDKNRRVVSIRFPFRNLIPTYIDENLKLYYYDYLSKDGKYGKENYLNLLPAF